MPAFQAEVGMPYWIDLHTTDVRKSTYFYSQLLGWTFDNGIARKDGLPVAGVLPAEQDTWVTYFLNDDLAQASRDIVTAGGRMLTEPTEVSLGTMAVAADAVGGIFGLIHPAGEDSFVAAGEPGTAVWHDYSATSRMADAITFYHEVFSWDIAGDEVFAAATRDGAAFAGFRDASQAFGPHVPSFWQTFLGVADVRAAAHRVSELGGEVIRAPFDTEFGLLTIISDSTGATVTLCETPEPVHIDDAHESDDLFHL